MIVTGLTNPWDLGFTPDGTMIFTERTGRICALVNGVPVTLAALPDVVVGGEGGLLGLAIDPSFASNRRIYVCYTTATDNRVVPFTVNGAFTELVAATPIVAGIPKNNAVHNGCRVRFGPDGMLWITTGDAASAATASDQNTLNGKVLRVDPANGNPATGNPNGELFFTRGHRNPQGIAFRANGQVYTTEHGPDRDDEVNLLAPGADYGWNGTTMTVPGATPALWSSGVSTVAPSGATFVNGPQWKGWNGALVVAVLKAQRLQVFVDEGGDLAFDDPTIVPTGVRLRSVVQGPDGNLYVATDVGGGGGAIWKVVPT